MHFCNYLIIFYSQKIETVRMLQYCPIILLATSKPRLTVFFSKLSPKIFHRTDSAALQFFHFFPVRKLLLICNSYTSFLSYSQWVQKEIYFFSLCSLCVFKDFSPQSSHYFSSDYSQSVLSTPVPLGIKKSFVFTILLAV